MIGVLVREERTQKQPREEGHVKREAEVGVMLGH